MHRLWIEGTSAVHTSGLAFMSSLRYSIWRQQQVKALNAASMFVYGNAEATPSTH